MKIAFVSCTKLKAIHPCSARGTYQSSSFLKKATKYIQQKDYNLSFVLSAKYGLLKQQDEIEPYELTLNNMRVLERKEWSKLVLK